MKVLIRQFLVLLFVVALLPGCKKFFPDFKKETVVLDPRQNPNEVHIFGGPSIDQSYANAPEIVAGAGTYNGESVTISGALKFDLGQKIPDDISIISAKLTLYSNPTPLNGHNGVPNSGPNNAMLIQRITSQWNPSELNWSNQPLTTTNDEVLIPHTDLPSKDLEVNVTELVKKMVKGQNNGFYIRLATESAYNFRVFCSSKYSDESKRPKLVVVYKRK